MTDRVEPTLGATRAAAESARAANHAAYNSPRGDVGNAYDRTGALHELLCCTEQVARMLADDVTRLRAAAGMTSTEGGDARGQALLAAADLADAAGRINTAAALVNSAWSYLSPLYVDGGAA